jgi:hypothetical protein
MAVVAMAATTALSNGSEPQLSKLEPRQLDTEPAASHPNGAAGEQADRGIGGTVLEILNWVTGLFDAPLLVAHRPMEINEQPQSQDLPGGQGQPAINTMSFVEMAEWLQRAGRQRICPSSSSCGGVSKSTYAVACIFGKDKYCCKCAFSAKSAVGGG